MSSSVFLSVILCFSLCHPERSEGSTCKLGLPKLPYRFFASLRMTKGTGSE